MSSFFKCNVPDLNFQLGAHISRRAPDQSERRRAVADARSGGFHIGRRLHRFNGVVGSRRGCSAWALIGIESVVNVSAGTTKAKGKQ